MFLIIAALFSLPQGGKVYTPWQLVYKGIVPKSGTDAYGYVYESTQDQDTVSFNWIDITQTGTNLSLGDEGSASITLPFTFKLYDDTTSTLYVQSNGGITFRNITLSYHNHALPDTNGTLIAVYWSDQDPSSHGGVYYQNFQDTMCVVEWYEVPEYNSSSYNTYEAIIYNDGRIKLQYLNIAKYSDETIGIQSKDAFSQGNGYYIQYVYNSNPSNHVPTDSTAILFEPPIPQDHDVGVLAIDVPEASYIHDTVPITIYVKNYGLNQETFDLRVKIDTNAYTVLDTTISSITLDTAGVQQIGMTYITDTPATYNITAFTILPQDTNYINDTCYTSFNTFPYIPLPYTTDFEQDSGYFYHSGTNDPWQWGAASYVHSGTMAWATSLTDTYPSNSKSTLYSYPIDLSEFSPYDSTYITFWYFDSLETDYDYVYLLITDDRGATWDTLKTYNGYATEWTQEYIDLKPYNGKKIQVAFLFESDGSVTKAGFFLDDFEIGIPFDNDVGIRAINTSPQVVRPNDTATIDVIVHNFGKLSQQNFYVKNIIYKGTSILYQDSTLVGALEHSADTILTISFVPQDTGIYTVISKTLLQGDENTQNDSSKATFKCGGPELTLLTYKIGGDGMADPGEQNVPIIVTLLNNGSRTDSVSLTLETTSSHITIHQPQHFIGTVFYGDTVQDTFLIDVSQDAQMAEEANFTLNISASSGYTNTSSFSILIGGKLWTIMVFINGDNNLTSYGVSDVDEMEKTGSTDLMNILVQFDGESDYTDSAGTHQDANRYYITHNPTPNDMIDAYPLMNLGEVDMGDTNVIFDFFKWGVDNYPAKHYMFVIWDHGSGWVKNRGHKGVSHDDTDGDYLSFSHGEARALFRKMHDYIGRNIDILGYDVCLVQMLENINEAYGYADYVVASEKSEPGDGWDYTFLQEIAQDPTITPGELAGKVVDYYASYYSSQSDVTLSAVKLGNKMQYLFGLVNKLSDKLIKAGGINRQDIQNIINNLDGEVEGSYEPYKYFVDLLHFVQEVKNANIDASISNVCDSIIDLYSSNAFFENAWASSDVSGSMHGISIMLPPQGQSLDGWEYPYSGLLLAKNTLWYRFLTGDTALPDTSHTTLYYAGFNINGSFTDSLSQNASGELHLYLSNFTQAPDSNVSVILSHPSYITLSSDTITIPEISEDTVIGISIPFTVSQDAPCLSNHITISLSGNSYNDTYYAPFTIKKKSLVSESQKGFKNRCFVSPLVRNNMRIQFSLKQKGHVNISLYDIQGRKVQTLMNKEMPAGNHNLSYKTDNMKNGIYFVIINTPKLQTIKRVVVIK